MTEVFVVVASAGQYDDYREWNVVAFADPNDARAFAANATAWEVAAVEHVRSLGLHWADRDRWDKLNVNPYDAESRLDHYSPTQYAVHQVTMPVAVLAVTYKPKRFRKTVEP